MPRNAYVTYIKNHKKDFEFQGVSLKEGVSSKVVEGAVPARPYVVFEIKSGQLTFKVGGKELISSQYHVTAFLDYDDSRSVMSAYHCTAICQTGEELRLYVDKNFKLLNVVVKQGTTFISFSTGNEQHEKEAVYQIFYQYVEIIFKHIRNIPDKARAHIDEQMSQLNFVSLSLNENPEQYRDELIDFLENIKAMQEVLPSWYYKFHVETKQSFLTYVQKIILKREKELALPVALIYRQEDSVAPISNTVNRSSENPQREQLNMLKEDFASREKQLFANVIGLHRIQLLRQQWDNLYQQIPYQFDISLLEVSKSLNKKQAIESDLVECVLQNLSALTSQELSGVLESLSCIIPMNKLIFSLMSDAIFQKKTGVIAKLVDAKYIQKETLDLHLFNDARLPFACNALRATLEIDALNVFQELLEVGVNPDSMTLSSAYYRCIEATCVQGKVEFLRLLLQYGSGDGAILPSVMGQFPMITDPGFDGTELASHAPMMIAARHRRVNCLRMLTENNLRLPLAAGYALCLHDDVLVQELMSVTQNGPRSLGDFSQQMILANQSQTVVEKWNIEIKNIAFLSLVSLELMKIGMLEGEVIYTGYSWYAFLLLRHPALSQVNVLMFFSNNLKRSVALLEGQAHKDSAGAHFTDEEIDLMSVLLIGHFVSRLLKLTIVSEEDENRILNGEMQPKEYFTFDRDLFLQQVNHYYNQGHISRAAFAFKYFLKELASPVTNVYHLATTMYALIFYNQQISFGGMQPGGDRPLCYGKIVFLLSALIQLKLISLLSLGKSATLNGSRSAVPEENQLAKMSNRLVGRESLDHLSVLDEVIATADSREIKVGVLHLKMSLLTLYQDNFYNDEVKFKELIAQMGRAEQDSSLKTVCDVGRKSEKGYWWWENLQMQCYRRDMLKVNNTPQTLASSSALFQPAESAGKGAPLAVAKKQ